MCNKKARFQESRFFEYPIAHLTLIAARKRHNARDVPSALPIHFLLYQMNASAYFNRRSPRGERLAQQQCCCETNRFQSTLPVGGATLNLYCFEPRLFISIHAPREGSDHLNHDEDKEAVEFQSTLPAKRATALASRYADSRDISIHAPREGSDKRGAALADHGNNFNPRSPWEERQGTTEQQYIEFEFQSTLPVGGATGEKARMMSEWEFQSTLPAGGATNGLRQGGVVSQFQSTLPAGGATITDLINVVIFRISIHAPRGGSDKLIRPLEGDLSYFNPRSPRGERLPTIYLMQNEAKISIHAPRGGSDG